MLSSSIFRKHNELPILVCDFLCFINLLTKNDQETLCGGRFNKYREIFEDLIKRLSKHAKLIFYEDGPVVEQKLSTWIKRHSSKYNETYQIMEKIYGGWSLSDITSLKTDYNEIPRVTTQTEMMEHVARQYGELVITFTRECDSEIARYAYNNPRVLAILADDTDFLIYPGNWRYFSIKNIDPTSLETIEYNRKALRSFLDLNDQQMVILSTLNGNDIIKYDSVRDNFHVTLDSFKHRFADFRFPKLAAYARNLSKLPQTEMINKIYQLIQCRSIEMVKESFEMYNPVFDVIEPENDLTKFCIDQYCMFTYAVLLHSPINFTCAYFDLSHQTDLFDVKVDMFEKQIGIILANMPERDANYEIITKQRHNEDYRSHFVKPKRIDDVPPILELLNRSDFPEHDDIRFKLLKWMMSTLRLKNYDLNTFPTNYLQDILTLVVLRHYKLIDQFEADLILLTIKHVETKTIPENLQIPSILNENAFRTSFLFSKFHMFLDRCFQVTGLSDIKV